MLPCGQCTGCRHDHAKMWAIRCVHEAKMHKENSFLTLTYRDDKLPIDGSLVKHHHQDFIKRLRSELKEKNPEHNGDLSYFHVGEYGKICPFCRQKHGLGRPHYHTLLFGYWPTDSTLHTERGGIRLYSSASLARLWGHGFVSVGHVTPESAAYCSRYSLKKFKGPHKAEHYVRHDCRTAEIRPIEPEYATMSRNPAIGKRYYERYGHEIRENDDVVVRGYLLKPPRYYDQLFDEIDPEGFYETKKSRRRAAKLNEHNNTPERLAVRKECHDARLKLKKRNYEDEN